MYPNLKLQIFRLGTHQNHIARALGIDESVLSKIIRGYRQPSQQQRRQLAEFLKVEEKWLFERYEGRPELAPVVPNDSERATKEPLS